MEAKLSFTDEETEAQEATGPKSHCDKIGPELESGSPPATPGVQ